ncbi:YqiJ family protein [Novosphingobium resinovorum]|uniref:YqiJ family protein n=1 Tax=Novosphingobium resinovorum TaxID=158500 RepID=UPI002ED41CA7|nr:YqiJ family protein [Novosphingobium resinovorum]
MLTRAESLPFSVALALMLMLALLQVVGAGDLIGGDTDFDIDAHGGHVSLDAGLLSFVGLGRVPFLMWLMLLLIVFGLTGLLGQELLIALTGHPLTAWIMGPLAALVSLPLTGAVARPLGRIMPRDETTAIDVMLLVGREAEIVIGTATQGSPARGRVVDHHGHPHHVMVEPDNEGQRFVQGEKVLLVRREGELFKAIARGDHYLPRL